MTTKTDDLFQHARGSWQEDLLMGRARLSGSDLKGRALKYKGHYMRSANNLIARLNAAGHTATSELRKVNGREWRVLVVDGEIVSAVD